MLCGSPFELKTATKIRVDECTFVGVIFLNRAVARARWMLGDTLAHCSLAATALLRTIRCSANYLGSGESTPVELLKGAVIKLKLNSGLPYNENRTSS